MRFDKSKALQARSHAVIPGGAHTYAKGDDQFPELSPGFIVSGEGCHVVDPDGNEYIEYGMGLRSVTLGHGYPSVADAAAARMRLGTNFNRPCPIEIECAEAVLDFIKAADQIKFTKDGSTATTAAVKLARAHTGKDLVALCVDHPFYSYDDWAISIGPMDAGIPSCMREMTATFHYNDLASVERVFNQHSGRVACVIMEPARLDDPIDGFLNKVRELCHQHGALFILDENITGFRWHLGGAQEYYGVQPDLSCFGKAMANGFALSALAGRREIMELGGINHDRERVFLLSTTHGAETHALAACIATLEVYGSEPVIEHLWRQGQRLAEGFTDAARDRGMEQYVGVLGKPCNLVYFTHDADGQPSQPLRTLFLQELLARGVLAPSLVVSYSHTDCDIDRTIEAVHEALRIYAMALEDGVEQFLVGVPSKTVFRRYC